MLASRGCSWETRTWPKQPASSTSAEPDRKPGRGRIYDSITDTIGDTPLVRLNRVGRRSAASSAESPGQARILQPDRQRQGPHRRQHDRRAGGGRRASRPARTLIEPTSGNTGIALAFVAAARGYRLILVMPETMSIERRKMLALLGAELVLTPGPQGMKGAIAKAEELKAEIADAVIPQQFKNPANPEIHRRTTAEEIWNDTHGEIDVFVAGVGTGGTITGVGQVLKPRRPSLKIVAVEPEDSPVLSGGQPGPHKIQGIGAGFVPDDPRPLGHRRGRHRRQPDRASRPRASSPSSKAFPVGISSGAASRRRSRSAPRPDMAGKSIVTVIPSFAERYISSALFEGL